MPDSVEDPAQRCDDRPFALSAFAMQGFGSGMSTQGASHSRGCEAAAGS